MRKPDFFIVGAPKSGTTSMLRYLEQHPEISMPQNGEPLFFATDLDWPKVRICDKEQYLSIFSKVGDVKRVGEKSVWYLYSKAAANEINQFNPNSRIIIMLRNPIEMIYSYYWQLVRQLDEDITNFVGALEAEEIRKKGKKIPERTRMPEALYYMEVAKYSVQVERYLNTFGKNRVHIIILDDLKKNPAAIYKKLLNFLDVKNDYQPEFRKHNRAVKLRSRFLESLVIEDKPPLGIRILPPFFWQGLCWRLKKFNRKEVYLSAISDPIRARLKKTLTPDIEILGDIIDRDLTFWCQ